ncbi:MAG: transaldolase [Actinomycetes bacterium]
MTATQAFTSLGQSLWLDDISKSLLDDGRLNRYIGELGVTGLTSNPAIFQSAIGGSDAYDSAINKLAGEGLAGEDLLFALMIDDLQRAADAFTAVHQRTSGVDGHVSLEVSPLLARDPEATALQAQDIHKRVDRANLLVKIPGTAEGLDAITRTIRAGIPVNVTLLFDERQFRAANNAVREGLEARLADGLPIDIASVASVFVSRWDKAVADKVDGDLLNRLGVDVMARVGAEYERSLNDPAWRRLMNHGARPQRLLWASTGTKDPSAPEALYVDELAAPLTVNTMPEKTLLAAAEQGAVAPRLDISQAEAELQRFAAAGVDVAALGDSLQDDGVVLFEDAWRGVLETLAGKVGQLEASQTA